MFQYMHIVISNSYNNLRVGRKKGGCTAGYNSEISFTDHPEYLQKSGWVKWHADNAGEEVKMSGFVCYSESGHNIANNRGVVVVAT